MGVMICLGQGGLRSLSASSLLFCDFQDIPIYFAALNKESDPEVIKVLTPQRRVAFLDLQYRGNNVLFHCIGNEVHPYAVKHILQQGYPEMVAARNQVQ